VTNAMFASIGGLCRFCADFLANLLNPHSCAGLV
jgi:hypothetical protein